MRTELIVFLLISLTQCWAELLPINVKSMEMLPEKEIQITDAPVTNEPSSVVISVDDALQNALSEWANYVKEQATFLKESGSDYEATIAPGKWSLSSYVKLYETLIDLIVYLRAQIELENAQLLTE
ncbi:Hypothetical predicted protein [Cloeon dipterum]|uniref:SXP/RAL-2 family protein Ani s 5-like cation-binding domain-containing protein n=1 Tax=Cloeon dipterum TaxID=197152 RepID=A0A8S1BWZ2_9INSE|nr:Hypothetical predicted protein [Cloeon dipterum]